MKKTVLIVSMTFAVLAAHAQGPLNPPGAPAPTMKTLEQVEPRIPITNLPVTISAPGSYYVTTNLTGTAVSTGITINASGLLTGTADSAGITINASGVTIDLMGFELMGVPGSLEGIDVPTPQKNIEIRNGTISNWGLRGVNASNADNSLLLNLRAYSNGWESTSQDGLIIGGASLIKACVAMANQGEGIEAGPGSIVSECVAHGNGGDGFRAGSGSTVKESTASSNSSDGFFIGDGGTVSECKASFNTGNGFVVNSDSRIANCTADSNGSDGDGAGIHVTDSGNRIEGNHCTNNERGIDVDSSGNFIARNTTSGNTALNWDVVATNVCLIVDAETTDGAISGDAGGVSPGSTDPNANFTY